MKDTKQKGLIDSDGVKSCVKCGARDRCKRGRCRPCANARNAAYYQRNGEQVKERVKVSGAAYRKANPEKRRANRRKYYKANTEKEKASNTLWRKNNQERCLKYSERYRENNAKKLGAHRMANGAILMGLIPSKSPCEVCGSVQYIEAITMIMTSRSNCVGFASGITSGGTLRMDRG